MGDIVSEVISAKTSKDFIELRKKYNLKMTKEFKQDMRKLDKLSKKAKKSNWQVFEYHYSNAGTVILTKRL